MNSLKFCDKPYPQVMLKYLFDMQQSKRMCDMVLIVENSEIHVHKLVLAAVSPYFSALDNFKESDEHKIEFHDVSKSALEAIVHFLYTGEMEITDTNIYDIMAAASIFQISALKLPISHFLISTVNSANCLEMLGYAELHGYEEVFCEVLKFVAENLHFVVSREMFLQTPAYIVQYILCQRSLTLNTILNTLGKWLKYNGCLTEFNFSDNITMEQLEEVYHFTIEKNPKFKDLLCNVYLFIQKYYLDKNNKVLNPNILKQNEVLLAIGGSSNGTIHSTVEAFSTIVESVNYAWSFSLPTYPDQDAISVIPTMSIPRMCFAVAQPLRRPEMVYVLGGLGTHSTGRALAECEKYDGSKNMWTAVKEMPKRVKNHAATWIYGRLTVTGGIGHDGKLINDVWEYLEKDDRWSASIPLLNVRADHSAVNVMGTLYVLGGQGGNPPQLLNTVERYNAALRTWVRVSDMPEPKYEFGCVVINEFIYVIGGATKHFILTSVHKYNTITDKWEACEDIPVPKSSFGCSVKNGKIFCVGGSDIVHGPLQGVDIYNPVTNRWSYSSDQLQIPRAYSRAATVKLYIEES